MKKVYQKPIAMFATMSFDEHILASGCLSTWVEKGTLEDQDCTSGDKHLEAHN